MSGRYPAADGAALARPASSDPAVLKPTISAPPALTNERRENSFSCRRPVINQHPPLPSRRRLPGSPSKSVDRSRTDTGARSSPSGSDPPTGSSSSKADPPPGSTSRSGNTRNEAPEHRSTPAATDADQAPQPTSPTASPTEPEAPRAS